MVHYDTNEMLRPGHLLTNSSQERLVIVCFTPPQPGRPGSVQVHALNGQKLISCKPSALGIVFRFSIQEPRIKLKRKLHADVLDYDK